MADNHVDETTEDQEVEGTEVEETEATETATDETSDGQGGAADKSGSDDTASTKKDEVPAEPAATGVDWKAMARKWEKRAKENASAAQKLKEAESAEKTEMEKLAEQIQALQAENQSNRVKAMRSEVSRKTGVPLELLSAETEEDLSEQAEAILEFATAKLKAEEDEKKAAAAKQKTTSANKPKEKLRSGSASENSEPSREDILAAVLGKGRRSKSGS